MQDAKEQKSGVLYEGKIVDFKPTKASPELISPGVVPHRLGGKTPKCFFSGSPSEVVIFNPPPLMGGVRGGC